MLVSRSSRRTVASVPAGIEHKEERPSFFQRKLARFLRRSSVASTSTPTASGALVSSGSLIGVPAGPPVPTSATVVDPEIVFTSNPASRSARSAAQYPHGVATSNGARAHNEDRFRVITDLELYVRALLRTVERASVADTLDQRVLEAFVLNGDAPSIATRVSSATSVLLLTGGGGGADASAPSLPDRTQLFGIYDGHGGARCSSLLALLYPLYLADAPQFGSDLAGACGSSSLAMNAEILARARAGECDGGATALTLLLRGRTVFLSNTGDCRAILLTHTVDAGPGGGSLRGTAASPSPGGGSVRGGDLRRKPRVVQLTTDHKATDADEKRRVEAAGGMILYVKGVARVNGRLAVTRAFGDADMGEVVIPDPQVAVHQLADDDEFVVLASDGLWDVMTNDAVAITVR